ncbi:hypothetical protein F511_22550 [Dorcoceras hygrometricum]|uniref:Uncharacterized protein n=1 Tax=Dorcoceras hygrometricum TaxID=472368 RepID=A0A2Z7CMB1_9LAMI|nr:hypothetical protein F511_22550 [Dorcoceras hygrometricum]
MHRMFRFGTLLESRRLAPTNFMRKSALQTVGGFRLPIRSTTGFSIPSSVCTRKHDEDFTTESPHRNGRNKSDWRRRRCVGGGGVRRVGRREEEI